MELLIAAKIGKAAEGVTTPLDPNSPVTQWFLKFYADFPWVGLLLLMMTLDIATGITAAIIKRRLSSKIGYRGMMRKAATLLVVGAAAVLEQGIVLTLPSHLRGDIPVPLAKLTAGFFFINEMLSVLENARESGAPLPAFLSKSLIDTLVKLGADKERTTVRLELKSGTLDATLKSESSDELLPVVPDDTVKTKH